MQRRIHAQHLAIKAHHLRVGGTDASWQRITTHPGQFNRVWRSLLSLPASDEPPPAAYRR